MKSTRPDPLTPSQQKLFDDFVAAYKTPMKIILGKYRGMVNVALAMGHTMDDVEQIGFIAIVKAARGFEPERGLKFATYATWKIRGELAHFIPAKAMKNTVANGGRLVSGYGCDSTQADAVPIFDKVGSRERLPYEVEEIEEDVRAAVSRLPKRLQAVLHMRFALGGCEFKTMVDAGAVLGISRGRIEQLQRLAFEQLREVLA